MLYKKFVKGTLWNDKKLWDHHNLVIIYIYKKKIPPDALCIMCLKQ